MATMVLQQRLTTINKKIGEPPTSSHMKGNDNKKFQGKSSFWAKLEKKNLHRSPNDPMMKTPPETPNTSIYQGSHKAFIDDTIATERMLKGIKQGS